MDLSTEFKVELDDTDPPVSKCDLLFSLWVDQRQKQNKTKILFKIYL